MALTIIFQTGNGKTEDKIQLFTERRVSGREGDHSHSKAKGEAQSSVITTRMGGCYMLALGFVPTQRFLRSQKSVQTLKKSFGRDYKLRSPRVYTPATRPHTHAKDPVVQVNVSLDYKTPK